MANFSENYRKILICCGLGQYASEKLSKKFERLTALLLETNAHTNLTAITDVEQIIFKHYADCLNIASFLPPKAKTLDVGCGGGFPTLPLAIARPDLEIFALDSTVKKLSFVENCAKELSLSVHTLSGRAEELGRNPEFREHFDAVTARAVATLSVLCEWCLPFVKVGGIFLAMKGADGQKELSQAQRAIERLGGQVEACTEHTVGCAKRMTILIRKTSSTKDLYPRRNAVILKNPL